MVIMNLSKSTIAGCSKPIMLGTGFVKILMEHYYVANCNLNQASSYIHIIWSVASTLTITLPVAGLTPNYKFSIHFPAS